MATTPPSTSETIFIRPPVWALFVAVVIGGMFYVYGKQVEVREQSPATIVVTGEGKASATPDIAELTFGVQTGPMASAKEAMASLQKQMNAIFDAVQKTGIPETDIQSQQFSMNPSYDYSAGKQTLRGYEAMQSLSVKVRDTSKVSDVLAAATNAGANQAGNVNFTVDDPAAAQAQARDKAITQAKEKAKTLADQLGMTLGKVKNFQESSGGASPPIMYGLGGVAMEKSSLPLPPGQQDITDMVTITYEIH